MSDAPRLKENYTLSKCCRPLPDCEITGYYSHDGLTLKVHRSSCVNLQKADQARLVSLEWKDILAEDEFTPDDDFAELDELDFRILRHHRDLGVDYSLKTARLLNIDKQTMFDRHHKLRDMSLLRRVEPLIIQYRKGVVNNKWIKHRNHTYYELTKKGRHYLEHFLDGPTRTGE